MTSTDRNAMIDAVKQAEGWRARAYQDSVGVWTIGYGRNLQAMTISRALGETWLQDDLGTAEQECRSAFRWFEGLTSRRQAVLVELVFNLGLSRLKKFSRTLAAAERGDFAASARHLLDSKWAAQVGPARSRRLADAWRRG